MKAHVFILAIGLVVSNVPSWAKLNDRYVAYFTHIESIDPKITTEQCQSIFGDPLYYSFVNNQPIYVKNKNLAIVDSKRLQKAPLETDNDMFLGELSIEMKLNAQTINAKNYIFYKLDNKAHTIQGGWYVPGYCKGYVNGKNLGGLL